MRKIYKIDLRMIVLLICTTIFANVNAQYSGSGTFVKITTLSDLTDGYYVIVNSGDGFAMNNIHNGTYLDKTSVVPVSGTIVNPDASIVWKIQSDGSNKTIFNEGISKYVSYTGSSNNVQIVDAVTADNQRWTFTYANDVFTVANVALPLRMLQYNASSPRFACYTTAQQKLLLYKYQAVVDGVLAPVFSPSGGLVVTAQNVSLSSATEGATIYYTTDGVEPDSTKTVYSAPFSVSETTTVKAIAYKSGMNKSSVASATYTFPTEVANIAALRAAGNGFYKLTGEAVLTFKTADRNAKYIQDATGGILIDDAAGILKTNYSIGDGITGITGTLGAYAGMLQFTPVADPGAATTIGNTVVAKEVKLEEMVNYPGQLVKVSAVTVDAEGVFVVKTNYNLSGSSTNILRTAYTDLPYLDTGIPQGPQDITGVVLIFNAVTQLVPRSINDFKATVITEPTLVVTEVLPLYGVNLGQSMKDTVYVDGFNLSANVSVSLSGEGAGAFSVSPTTLTPANGTLTDAAVEITYNSATAGDHVATLTFSSTGAADVVKTLTGKAFSMTGDGSVERPFTVGDVIAMNNSLGATQKYWVKGYVVGSAGGGTGGVLTSVATVAPFSPSALAIAASSAETNLAAMVPVQLPVGDVRVALNLLDNPSQLGKEVKLFGTLEAYFTAPGVKNVTEYAIVTGMNTIDASRFTVTSANGNLLINAAASTSVEVYNAVGQRVYNGVLSQGLNSVKVDQSGLLIVKIEGATQKVVL